MASPANVAISTEDYFLPGRSAKSVPHRRVVVATTTVKPAFKLIFIPLKTGEDAPPIQVSPDGATASLSWADQKDVLTFTPDKNASFTQLAVTRDGKTLFSGFPAVKIYPSAKLVATMGPGA